MKSKFNAFPVCLIILMALALFLETVSPNALAAAEMTAGATYAAIDPRGQLPDVELIPLADREADLNGKAVYFVLSWPKLSGFEPYFEKMAKALSDRFPEIKVVIKNRNTPYARDDKKLWEEMKANCAGFVYAAAPSSSTTSYAFKWSAKLEKMGIPGVVLYYDALSTVASGMLAREGAPLRSVAVKNPIDAMNGKELAAANDQVIKALTTPLTPAETKTGIYSPPAPPRIAIEGNLAEIQAHFYEQGWTDALPITPPTEDNVAAMLKGTSHAPDEVVAAEFVPERLRATVEKVAVNAVMAGCKPAYMPVLLAAVEAFSKGRNNSVVRSTGSFSFMQLINGPIRQELEMNAGTYALGPGNHANATIGRALRLFIHNLGGGRPGENMMGVIGNVSAYTFCFPENEEQSPWEAFSVGSGGKQGESTLTLFKGGWAHWGNYGYPPADLIDVAKDIAVLEYPSGVVVIIGPKRARMLHDKGMSKTDVAEYIWKNATLTLKEFRSSAFFPTIIKPAIEKGQRYSKDYLTLPDDTLVPVYPRKEVHVVVAGGDAVPMMQAWHMGGPVTVSVDKWR